MEIQIRLSPKDLGRSIRRVSLAAALTAAVLPAVAHAQEGSQTDQNPTPVVSGTDAQGNVYTPVRTCTQCGGELNGEILSRTHTFLVDLLQDPAGASIYGIRDLGDLGQCGRSSIFDPAQSQQLVRTYTQCGGDANGLKYAHDHLVGVRETVTPNGAIYDAEDLGARAGYCGNK